MAEMIRLRIDLFSEEERIAIVNQPLGLVSGMDGVIWFKDGAPVGRVIIEQMVATFDPAVPKGMDCYPEKWIPVEVIDEQT